MSVLADLAGTFSILHDGYIDNWSGDEKLIRLKIDCRYLAELIDPSHEAFFLDLAEVSQFELAPWWRDAENNTVLKDLKTIFGFELEILEASVKDKCVEVICNNNDHPDYAGGSLLINCKSFAIYDQKMNSLTIRRLEEVCDQYWTKFGSN